MAAGAIPPPQFFERRRPVCHIGIGNGILVEHLKKYTSVDHAVERPARSSLSSRDRSLSKDI
jgi:hypothetical protein